MNDVTCFLDVNIPMYAAGKAHPYKEACVWILTEVANGRLEVVIDAEIIQEILYRYSAIQQWQIGVQMAQSLLDLVPTVLPVTVSDMKTAVSLFARYAPRGIKARNIVHTAIMQNHGLTYIISTDKHFDQIKDVIRLDPQAMLTKRSL